MLSQAAATSADQEPRRLHYQLLNTIGHGSYAKVKVGEHLPTGTKVAAKIIQKQRSGRYRTPILREANSMASLRHPNIVELYEVINTKECIFLIMELVGGQDLGEYLQDHGPLTECEARGTFRQLVSAVQYCHKKGVIHRDLKPQNVLLCTDMQIKLIDFGISARYYDSKLSTFCGSLAYTAPEILRKEEYHGPPVDIWSLGVLLYKMVTGTIPFPGETRKGMIDHILKGEFTVPCHLTIELNVLLQKLITMNPEERSTLTEIMPDAWLNEGYVEKLTPFSEPRVQQLNNSVIQQMVSMGYTKHQIYDSLRNNSYDTTMGTYLILNAKTYKPQHDTRFRPPEITDHRTLSPTSNQEDQRESPCSQQTGQQKNEPGSGRKVEESATPSGSQKSSDTKPRPSPQTRDATPGHRATDATTGPSPQSRNTKPGPGAETTDATPGPGPQTVQSVTGPSPRPTEDTPGSGQQPTQATLGPDPPPTVATATPDPHPTDATPGPGLSPTDVTQGPSLQATDVTRGHSHKSRDAPPGRSSKPRKSSPEHNLKSRDATPRSTLQSRKASYQPSPKRMRVMPRQSPQLKTAIPRTSPTFNIAIPSPTPPSILESEVSTTSVPQIPELEGGTTTAPPNAGVRVQDHYPPTQCWTESPGPPVPRECWTQSPEAPVPHECRSQSPGPPVPRECWTQSPGPLSPHTMLESVSRTTVHPPILESGSRANTPPAILESEMKIATPSSAPQYGPGDTRPTHNTSGSRGSNSRGRPERESQGRRGLARRCLKVLKKLCCLPCSSGEDKEQ